ncbi:somatostatin-1-like [Xyrichtys novacula]|uniref:Somatostatin-1-like n=1 Tax=Xyrichtys novacula TaxID=13765 RepID=A0AAV1GEX8_XYRNO|nr:somatostatin-1-like [Xyrichtys novacula]
MSSGLTKSIRLKKEDKPKISQNRMAHTLCVLALVCFAFCAVASADSELGLEDIQLQEDSLSWLDKSQDKQESKENQSLVDLLYKISQILQGPFNKEKQEKRRGLSAHTRGPNCRFFFWKALTTC